MTRSVRKAAMVVLALLVVGAGAWAAWLWSAKRSYQECVEDLRRRGKPVALADLATPPIPDDRNAAVLLRAASDWLKEHNKDESPLVLYGWGDPNQDWPPEVWEELDSCLKGLEPYFRRLEQVATRDGWRIDYGWQDGRTSMEHISWFQDAGFHLEHRVRFDRVDRQRTDRAARTTRTLLDLANRFEPVAVIDYGVQIVTWREACRILRLACDQAGFDASSYRKQVDPHILAALRRQHPPERVLDAERAFLVSVLRGVVGGGDSIADELFPEEETGWLRRQWFGRPLMYGDVVSVSRLFDRAAPLCDTTPEEAARVAREFDDPYRGPRWQTARAVVRVVLGYYAETVTVLRLGRIVMALLEYKQAARDWPEDLSALEPLFPDGIPQDPYSESAFLYERTSQGARIQAAGPHGDWDHLLDRLLAWELD